MNMDDIITLPSGTELSGEAALGDIGRAREILQAEGYESEASDISHVAEFITALVGKPDIWHDDEGVWRQVGNVLLGPFASEAEAEAAQA